MRLKDKLVKNKSSMETCYSQFASYVTELKMEHNHGLKKSEELSKFLGNITGLVLISKKMLPSKDISDRSYIPEQL